MKSLGLTTFMYAAGAVATAVAGYFVWEYNYPSADQPAALLGGQTSGQSGNTEPAAESSDSEAKEDPTQTAKLSETPSPLITLLRVEPDGSTIVAGNGPANTIVSLFNGTEKIAETKSEAGGDFAFVLDKPLTPGNHEIAVAATLQDGTNVPSEGLGLVQIPDPAKGGELTVLLTKPGEATQVLSKTELEPVVSEEEVAAATQTEPDTNATQASDEQQETSQTEEVKPELAKVELQAADIEGDKIYIAGTGEPGSTVTLFMGKVFLGQTVVAENGAFLLEVEQIVPTGKHNIRADLLDSETWDLQSTTEVSLVHEPEQEVASTVTSEPSTEAPTEEADASAENVKEVVAGTSVIIRKGDSLWRVARRNYGQGIRYTTIFEANRDQIRNPRLIYPGQVLKVPEEQ